MSELEIYPYPLVGELNDLARKEFWRTFEEMFDIDEVPKHLWTEVEEILGNYLEGEENYTIEHVKRALETLLRELGIAEWKSKAEILWEQYRKNLKRLLASKKPKVIRRMRF